ncbi:MAG: 4Fe-4S binding protein [candidate division Zixibacteria bacterium]|nr:4Fe-4S binding protein [candidate division Zixibacteria bacterium]MBU1472021.1 4Fe-4S binding protein [candidate division Zixibacteria bacterium]MBU2624044.1 4Fe-4S binding protein [candidate division Zixibacteria bacterium]
MTIETVRNLRRTSQGLFLAIFLILLLRTGFSGSLSADAIKDFRLSWPVAVFLQFDPLMAISTMLTTWRLYDGLLWSLILVVATLFFGRFFCGWVCPTGTVNHLFSLGKANRKSLLGKSVVDSNRWHRYQKLKYYILILMLGAALLTSLLTGILDPLSLLIRSVGLVVIPMVLYVIDFVNGILFGAGATALTYPGIALNMFSEHVLLMTKPVHYHTIISLGLFFFLVLATNRVFTRFWCRGICPLGALLGILSRWSILGMEKCHENCTDCNLCLKYCQGGDDPIANTPWRKADCHLCLNCQAVCPENVIKFKLFPKDALDQVNPAPDITRRKVAASILGGAVAVPLMRSGDDFEANFNEKLIRPPGSVSEDQFLSRCVRCGECMKVCPNNALHPTFLEAGWEGIWSPILIPRIGYCEHTCTLCSQVCPTGAIREITLEDKVGTEDKRAISIGTAFFDRGRCLPWAMATPCIVCEEWCPTSPKAIYFVEEEVVGPDKKLVTVKRPHMNPDVCIGCGACEKVCPIVDKPAVYVTSVGETRSSYNQILLERTMKRKSS